MICPECGSRNAESRTVCHRCGAPLPAVSEETAPVSAEASETQELASPAAQAGERRGRHSSAESAGAQPLPEVDPAAEREARLQAKAEFKEAKAAFKQAKDEYKRARAKAGKSNAGKAVAIVAGILLVAAGSAFGTWYYMDQKEQRDIAALEATLEERAKQEAEKVLEAARLSLANTTTSSNSSSTSSASSASSESSTASSSAASQEGGSSAASSEESSQEASSSTASGTATSTSSTSSGSSAAASMAATASSSSSSAAATSQATSVASSATRVSSLADLDSQDYVGTWAGELDSTRSDGSGRCYGAQENPLQIEIKSIDSTGRMKLDVTVLYHGHKPGESLSDVDEHAGDVVQEFLDLTATFADGSFLATIDESDTLAAGMLEISASTELSAGEPVLKVRVHSGTDSARNGFTDYFTLTRA